MLPGTNFYSWYSYSLNSRFIPGITVIPSIIYSSFKEPAPGEQHKFPGSEWQKQAQIQVLRNVKCMMCPPNCVVIFQGFYMKCQPVAFI